MTPPFPHHAARRFDIRDFGARGDGEALATDAINAAIIAAADGGGLVTIPAGRFLCFTLRLASHVTIAFEKGAVIEAADPAHHGGAYELPEPRPPALYQDFGHSHWHNSLFVGDRVEEVAIIGPGLIDGRGLTRDGPGAGWRKQAGERPLSMAGMSAEEIAALEPPEAQMRGLGNKAIGLHEARHIHLTGFTMRDCGHFAILASGCEQLTIADLSIDTQRDGIDLDCVRDATVERCRVNTPNDDAIVVKSSLALGRAIASERIVIRGCTVSGYDPGTMLDGSFGRTQQLAPDRDRVTGRIKLGTESNGGFRDILIEDCRFERSRGLALEMVDGGTMENITARRLVMEDVTTAPLFIRLGDRRRGPEGTGIGAIRNITISDVTASGIDPRFAATIAGLPDHPVSGVTLRDIRLAYSDGSAIDPPPPPGELADAYPEPSMFGPTPAWGLWLRHAQDITIEGLELTSDAPGARPAIIADDVAGSERIEELTSVHQHDIHILDNRPT
jgi:polygalacturonase